MDRLTNSLICQLSLKGLLIKWLLGFNSSMIDSIFVYSHPFHFRKSNPGNYLSTFAPKCTIFEGQFLENNIEGFKSSRGGNFFYYCQNAIEKILFFISTYPFSHTFCMYTLLVKYFP